MTIFKKKLFALAACLLVIFSTGMYSVPAHAAEPASEFDFSASDDLNKYDSYDKELVKTTDGQELSCVDMPMVNGLGERALPAEDTRYSAYLRSNDEVQRFFFYNLYNLPSQYSTVWNNTLTIYADPGVQFKVTDYDGIQMADSNGQHNSKSVHYYNKSTENGHSVYYIELNPGVSGRSRCIVEFSTTTATAQPHYSLWFGSPLVRTATAAIGNIDLSVSYPNTASFNYSLKTPYKIPERAWVDTITVRKTSSSGNGYLSRATLKVTLPGDSSSTHSSVMGSSDSIATFNDHPCGSIAHSAAGTHKFSLTDVKWASSASVGSTYKFWGSVTMTYLYAFGA